MPLGQSARIWWTTGPVPRSSPREDKWKPSAWHANTLRSPCRANTAVLQRNRADAATPETAETRAADGAKPPVRPARREVRMRPTTGGPTLPRRIYA